MAAMMHAVAVKEGARSLSLQHHRQADRLVITLPTHLYVLALVSLSPSSSYYVGRVATRKEGGALEKIASARPCKFAL